MIRNLIFDVDGTLWDSAEAVAASWNHVLRTKYPTVLPHALTKADMYRNMGKTMTQIGLGLFPAISEDLREQIMQDVMSWENEYLLQHPGEYYPGLKETLKNLKEGGYHLFIVSNCQDGYIQALLSHHDLQQYFTDFECFGRTGLPKDGSIRILMDRCRLQPQETVYIGDTEMDETAAGKAGIRFIHASYGFGTAAAPAAVIRSVRELPDALVRLQQQSRGTVTE